MHWFEDEDFSMSAKMMYLLPLFEVSILDSAGETFPADPDSFQHTVTPELVDDQEVLHETCGILLNVIIY